MSFSKVEVRSQHELLKIEELLDAAADNWLQVRSAARGGPCEAALRAPLSSGPLPRLQARAGQVPEELVAALKAANVSLPLPCLRLQPEPRPPVV